jgi:hypothetical protein
MFGVFYGPTRHFKEPLIAHAIEGGIEEEGRASCGGAGTAADYGSLLP